MVFGLSSTAVIWAAWWIHFRARRSDGTALPNYRLPLELVGVALLAITGHLGGFLSGVNS
jgi:uncharacterized membrane protein